MKLICLWFLEIFLSFILVKKLLFNKNMQRKCVKQGKRSTKIVNTVNTPGNYATNLLFIIKLTNKIFNKWKKRRKKRKSKPKN